MQEAQSKKSTVHGNYVKNSPKSRGEVNVNYGPFQGSNIKFHCALCSNNGSMITERFMALAHALTNFSSRWKNG